MKAVKGKGFIQGVHVPDMKYLSNDAPVEVLPEPQEVVISTLQSMGKPAKVIVAVGDKVAEGQLIATADGAFSSNVFASISGEVTAIKEAESATGSMETCVFIKGDGEGRKAWLAPLVNPTQEEIKQRVFDAGIVGLGGAGFPTAIKVNPPQQLDTFILNGAECEPYLTCDYRMMIDNTDEVAQGVRLLAKALGVTNVIVAIEANKPLAIAAFEKYDDFKVVILKKQYPMGSEKQLIYSATGKKVPAGQRPLDIGVAVNNVATAYYTYQAVVNGKPLYENLITVSGKAIAQPKNVWVKVGTHAQEIIDFCGGETNEPVKVIQGGPMTGNAISTYDIYTHKTTSGYLLLSKEEADLDEPTPCLNCGKCADVCPMQLMPMQTAFYAEAGDYQSANKYGGAMHCVECGACAYICPAKRPLIQNIRKTKSAIRNQK